MTEIEQAKNLLKQWNWRGITEDLDTVEEREAILQLESSAISLITTIESQKEEMNQTTDALLETLERVHNMESEINKLRFINTKLENGLKGCLLFVELDGRPVDGFRFRQLMQEGREILSEIERIQNATS